MTSPADYAANTPLNGAVSLPAVLSSAPGVVTLLKALRRRWLLASSLGVTCAAAAAVTAWLVMPMKYTARALLDVAANPPRVIFNTNVGGDPFHTYQKKQLAFVKSRLVLAAALRHPKVAELSLVRDRLDPAEWLETQVQTDYSVAPEILRVAITGDDPKELVVLVDAIVQAYLQEIVNKEHKRRLERLEQLKELYNAYEDTLRRKRQTVRDFAQSAGSADAKTMVLKHRFAIEQLAMAEKELMELQSQLRKLQVEASDQQGKEKTVGDLTVPEAVIAEHLNADPVIRHHLDQLAGLEQKLDLFKQRALEPEKEQAYKKTITELETTRTALAARRQEIRPRIIQELREKARDDLKTGVGQLRARGGLLKEHEKVLSDLVDRLRKETLSINQKGLTLDSLQDDIPRGENLVKTVANELDALNVELQAPPRVTLLEAAGMGQTDTRKRKLMAAGASGAGTLLLVLCAVAFWEFRWRRVNTVDEVVHGLGVSLIGAVPRLPNRAQRSLATSQGPCEIYWQNLLVESVKTIRTMLLHTAGVDSLRIVMVTSALGGEGKTSLSSQLAISLARAGRKTLLVDGDLRRASVHRVFNVPISPGFSEVLRAEIDLPGAIHAGPVSDLWILPAGRSTNDSFEALAQEAVPALFARLREQFDFVVVDSCPVLPVADSLLIGQHVDGVIFTLLREVSRLPQVYAGYQRLASLGIRMLGIVVNGAGGDVYGSTYSEYQYLDRSPA